MAGGEKIKEVAAAREGADSAANAVAMAEELVGDVGGDEPICARDKDEGGGGEGLVVLGHGGVLVLTKGKPDFPPLTITKILRYANVYT